MKIKKNVDNLALLFALSISITFGAFLLLNPTDSLQAADGVVSQVQQDDEGNEQDENENEEGGNDDDNATPPANTPITAEQAKAIAEAAYPGTTTREVEYEHEGGIEGFEVELDNGLEVMVDPMTGEIIGSGTDD